MDDLFRVPGNENVMSMLRKIKRIDPMAAAKMLAVVQAAMGLIFVVPLMFMAIIIPLAVRANVHSQHLHANGSAEFNPAFAAGVFVGMALFMPVLYGVIGFLMGLIGSLIYNLVAHWTGGLQVEVE